MRTFPLGDAALTIEFGREISPDLNRRAIAAAKAIAAADVPGVIETVPAYSSVSVFYDPALVRRLAPDTSPYETIRRSAETAISSMRDDAAAEGRTLDIPVSFDLADAIDLPDAAAACGLESEDFVRIFLSRTYRVYMIGFLPGFAYMGEVDEQIAVGRRATPRLRVPKGSVGIAGSQTGIYPLESPGGWQIIGRTHIDIFTPEYDPPTLLAAGDQVRFHRR